MNRDVLIAIYGITQMSLKEEDDLDSIGKPRSNKHDNELTRDSKDLYKWLSYKLKGVTEYQINDRKGKFNEIATRLEKEYLLNMFLMAVFMFEQELDDHGTKPEKIVLAPKISRIIKKMREGIINKQENGQDIVRDSKIGASNIIRGFNGQPELTKKMREYKLRVWRDAAKNTLKMEE